MEVVENPFKNPYILSRVFSFVRCVEDLKNIRLTNTTWLRESSSQWNVMGMALFKISCSEPQAERSGSPASPCNCQADSVDESGFAVRPFTMPAFLETWEATEPRVREGWRHFVLQNCCILHPPTKVEYLDVIRFLDYCGERITYLHLDHVYFHNDKYGEGFKWIAEKCPNLRKIIIIFDGFCRDDDIIPVEPEFRPSYDLNWLSIIRCASPRINLPRLPTAEDYIKILTLAPRLRIVEIKSLGGRIFYTSPDSTNAEDNQIDITTFKLSEFTSEMRMMSDLMHMTVPTLRGLRLNMDMIAPCVNGYINLAVETTFRNMLITSQNCVGELKLTGQPLMDQSLSRYLQGLQFQNLTRLYLCGECEIRFMALRGAPNINLLHVKFDPKYHQLNRALAIEGEMSRGFEGFLEGLVDFYIDYIRLKPSNVRLLKLWMPNIRRFGIVVNQTTKVLVKELWPNLEQLTYVVGSIIDEQGIPILQNKDDEPEENENENEVGQENGEGNGGENGGGEGNDNGEE